MTRSCWLLVAGFVLCGSFQTGEAQNLRLEGGWRFDTRTEKFEKNGSLLVRGGKIAGLKAADADSAAQVMRLADDDYILPGIVDLHAHYNVRLIRRRRDETTVTPIVYLANGVTTTFSAGEYNPEEMRAARLRMESGKQIGPRLINSGPYFGRARPGWKRDMSAAAIHREVDHWVRMGVGGFKAKLISTRHLQALVNRAHHHGLTVTGHLESGYRDFVNPKDAINLGIDRVEHFLGGETISRRRPVYSTLADVDVNSPEFKEITELFINKGVYFDATVTAYGYFGRRGKEFDHWTDETRFFTPYVKRYLKEKRRPRRVNEQFERIYQKKQKTILAFFKAGGKITLGSDHFSTGDYLAGFSAHREMDVLVRAGIPAAKVIKIATINGARALRIDKRTGSIEVGKSADLFIIKGDPLKNIRCTRSVHTVVCQGKLHRTAELLESVEGKLGPRNEQEARNW